jgi:hypothetical protein
MGRSNAPVLWFSKNWTSSGVGAIISAGSDYIDIGLGFFAGKTESTSLLNRQTDKARSRHRLQGKARKAPCGSSILNMPEYGNYCRLLYTLTKLWKLSSHEVVSVAC